MITPLEIYDKLLTSYGQPKWWSDQPFMVMVQSILVQNTSWGSVKKVTVAAGAKLTPEYILGMPAEELENLTYPCGCCKRKATTIRRLTEWYGKYNYQPEKVKALELLELRNELLAIKGIGSETADVILVYGFHKPSFVIDAYTRRFLERLGFNFTSDNEMRSFFEQGLDGDYRLYGWYHWLILEHGIKHCRKVPACDKCIFENLCSKRNL